MSAKVQDVMAQPVMTATPHQTVSHVRDVMQRHHIHAMPVLGPEEELVGIVSVIDLLNGAKDTSPVSTIMSEDVTTIPEYADISKAARTMRNGGIHHLVVTHEHKVVGILSTFDLLKVVEEHRFVLKNSPNAPGRPRSPRDRKQGRIRR